MNNRFIRLITVALIGVFILLNLNACGGRVPYGFVKLFREADRVTEVATITASDTPFRFEENPGELELSYEFKGRTYELERFFKRTATTSFLVVKNDEIVYERYFQGADESSRLTSFSMAKSFVSALVGIAIEEGYIESVDDPITRYVPELKGSGYDGVPIKHVLQMSSGVKFSENYYNPFCDLWVMAGRLVFLDRPMDKYMANRKSKEPSGERFHYASVDTQALGMLLRRTKGRPVAEYLEEKIWHPLGMESDAFWNVDCEGVELVFCCLNATAKDYAKFGRLYMNGGNWNGEQIVAESWVLESIVPDSPHLQPGRTENSWGYQYQWWVPEDSDGEFMAVGIFGQYLYVYPKEDLIIVKTSADMAMNDDECLAVFRAVAEYLRGD